MAVETRDIESIFCAGCGAHLCNRSGSHFVLLSDPRQKILVPGVDYIKCRRLITQENGEKQPCNTIWKP